MGSHTKPLLALFAASLIWGVNPLVNSWLLPYGNPVSIICLRFYLSSSTIFFYLLWMKKVRIPSLKEFFYFCILGLCMVPLNNTVVLIGLKYSTVTHSALINALNPLIVAFLSFVILREHLVFLQWFGIFLAAISTVTLIAKGDLSTLLHMQMNVGDALFLFSQLSWATYMLVLYRKLQGIALLELVAWSGFLGASMNLLYGGITGALAWPHFAPQFVFSLAFTTWATAMGAMLLWNYGLKHVGPSISAVFINLATLIAVSIGVFFLQEPFNVAQCFAAVGVIAGTVLLAEHNHVQKILRKYS